MHSIIILTRDLNGHIHDDSYINPQQVKRIQVETSTDRPIALHMRNGDCLDIATVNERVPQILQLMQAAGTEMSRVAHTMTTMSTDYQPKIAVGGDHPDTLSSITHHHYLAEIAITRRSGASQWALIEELPDYLKTMKTFGVKFVRLEQPIRANSKILVNDRPVV
jgi:hypothetical protein